MNKSIKTKETIGEIKNNDLLNESILSEINSSILSGLNEQILNRDNLDINSFQSLFNSKNNLSFLSRDQYACTICELPPEILYDSSNGNSIKIKCEKHGIKSYLIKDFLQKMSKNTYHFYKCGFCQKNCQKNFTQIFQYCFHCKNILCPKCLIKHKSYQNHKNVFSSNEINIRCEKHLGEKYIMYCYDCDKSICKKCSEETHCRHFFINLKELNPAQDVVDKIKSKTEKLKEELNDLIKRIEFIKNIIILNELIVSTYQKYENNYHHIINVSNLYKSMINNKFENNFISNISSSNELETPNYDLLITKFNLKIENKTPKSASDLPKINKMKKKISSVSSKVLTKNNTMERNATFLSTAKTNKGKIISNSNLYKKYNINIDKNSKQIILNKLKLDDDDFKEICSINLPCLTKLSLSENSITSLAPLSKIKSTQLEELYLDNNSITNIDCFKKINISSLMNIILYSNKISSIDCLSGLSFTKLIQLNLYNNKVSNIDSLANVYMPKLQILHLGFNKIKNIDILEKVYFPELISLNLNRNEISNIDILSKVTFPKLEKLDFFDNNISNIDALSKVNFPCLKELNLWINNIQNIKPLCNAEFPLLEKLNLSNNNIIDLRNFNKLKFPELNELNIQYNKIDMNCSDNIKILNELQNNIAIIKY